ncbi:hypothetical protein SASPL_152511 [Salvia splendens]|uniref:DUF2921 domain-containing protein n=1 Tax=Salvia splendens TaxID=180675 RepID=A0A8X8W3R4_SALSN|nr:hypothetical protein SASPL_152511 [Salvia splendens]
MTLVRWHESQLATSSRAQGMIRFWLEGLWSDKSRHLMMHMFSAGPGAGCWVFTGEKIVLEVEYGSFLLFTPIQCSPPQSKMRYIPTFQNTTYGQGFGLNSTVIGEAFWDDDKRELLGVACRLLDPLNQTADEKADCKMRHIHDSSYFGSINLIKSDGFGLITLPDVRYEYTKLGEVRRSSCAANKSGKNTYPDVHSDKMQLDLSLHNLKGQQIAWVYASPLWVGNGAYKKKKTIVSPHNTSHSNMSYMISLSSSSELKYGSLFASLNWSINANDQVEITAEGVYDAETGCLCMVGCRNSNCEILVTLKFSQAKGSIKSTRAKQTLSTSTR